ncbi:BZ3500_MvSof-1268-A1-R1_Chr2-1g04316 [Microbotryum saponariae]|uniref:BZ3500_MvSof-1268-A1-R1_Chr2-1g04316 protein n=1 Tax=Microbotryum saponariae TaxID=289078 RepID=A0A2X0KDH5_9BASI|nr:BZ3500_MvSof-1268-A1-R1_Chr2-1g04316 [Microbotryum saponariae]SCZ91412.1 BZ3501_MvSof-1269-A2-R1_Chr2-1g03972 [Microbotryum saponariae]
MLCRSSAAASASSARRALTQRVIASSSSSSSSSATTSVPSTWTSIRSYSASNPVPKANVDYLEPTHSDETPSKEVQSRLAKYASVTLATYSRPPFILSKGDKCTLWDSEGREYLDLSGGIAVNALGHADKGVQKVLTKQSGLLVHNSNLYHNEWAGELAYLLVEQTKRHGGMGFTPGSHEGMKPTDKTSGLKVFFSNSGTEANEGALKFVRKYGKGSTGNLKAVTDSRGQKQAKVTGHTDKVEIVSFRDGFHGRSLGALSATWQEKYQAPFAPLVPGIVPADLNDIEALQTVINENTCGVIVEPIQGEGGILEATPEFLKALRKRCDEVGALLIFDEIQVCVCALSYARKELSADSLFLFGINAVRSWSNGITLGPWIITGRLPPRYSILMKDKVADVIKIGDHGTTFGGGPLQTRVAHHVLGRISEPAFLENVTSTSKVLRERLATLPGLFPRLIAGPPRGRGLIMGIPFTRDEYVQRVLKLARERGVLLLGCGKSTVRFVPSLIITTEEIEKAMDVLESCLVVVNRQAEGV